MPAASSPVSPSLLPAISLPGGAAALHHADGAWGLVRVQGDDATRFLHAQTTQDFVFARAGQARLAAYCNPKGRMLGSMIAWADSAAPTPTWLLLCRRDVLPALVQRLRLFVLRSKVTLSDATAEYAIYGLCGAAALHLWQADVPPSASAPHASADADLPPWQHRTHPLPDGQQRHLVSLYPAVWGAQRMPRLLCVQPAHTPAPAPCITAQDWELGEVLAGIAPVTHATREAYVPQMLNYESVEGVHFKKGCYPGQEVVARSQFRGTIKRRSYISIVMGDIPHENIVGADIWGTLAAPQPAATEADAPCPAPEPVGTVALAAPLPHPAQGMAVIASLHTNALHTPLHLGAATGARLTVLPLPYALKTDI